VRAFAGCGKCELDKSEFSAASPHTKERNSLLISLFQTHTHTGGLSAAKKKSRRATGMFFYFYFLCTARCSRYWRFSSSFFLSSTQSGAAAFFSLSQQHQLSTFLNNAGVAHGSNEIIGSPREADFCVSPPHPRTSSPSLPVAAD
jgi:hypothetical protein